jgi:hypothetical protein
MAIFSILMRLLKKSKNRGILNGDCALTSAATSAHPTALPRQRVFG